MCVCGRRMLRSLIALLRVLWWLSYSRSLISWCPMICSTRSGRNPHTISFAPAPLRPVRCGKWCTCPTSFSQGTPSPESHHTDCLGPKRHSLPKLVYIPSRVSMCHRTNHACSFFPNSRVGRTCTSCTLAGSVLQTRDHVGVRRCVPGPVCPALVYTPNSLPYLAWTPDNSRTPSYVGLYVNREAVRWRHRSSCSHALHPCPMSYVLYVSCTPAGCPSLLGAALVATVHVSSCLSLHRR